MQKSTEEPELSLEELLGHERTFEHLSKKELQQLQSTCWIKRNIQTTADGQKGHMLTTAAGIDEANLLLMVNVLFETNNAEPVVT